MTTELDRSFDLLLPGGLDVDRIAAALAGAVSVPVGDVDVAARDEMDRDWDAAVLCTYAPAAGDISWMLDVRLSKTVSSAPGRETVAAVLADRLAQPVLYEAGLVSDVAYWLAAPGGWRTRARVHEIDDSDDDDRPMLAITAVERPVAELPGVPVEDQPEVIRYLRLPTPIGDAWLARAESALAVPVVTGDPIWRAGDRLSAWEMLTVRMRSGWPPDGWYPVEYYRHDLEIRDELAGVQLPAAVAESFAAGLSRIDEAFRDGTREADLPALSPSEGWWWSRRPDPEPWGNTQVSTPGSLA